MRTEPGRAVVRVENATREFGRGRARVVAVREVSLSSGEGELTLVMGPSGSGKTTLLCLIGGLLRPTGGRIWIGDLELSALHHRELTRARRELMGFVFQGANLLQALTARENVEIALNIAGVYGREAHRRAQSLLVEAGLGERLDFNANDLSGGERQRVAIARAIANAPRLLLADEPTANLDSAGGQRVMEQLRSMTREQRRTAIVVSHDARLEALADRVLWMEDGTLADAKPGYTEVHVGTMSDALSARWVDA